MNRYVIAFDYKPFENSERITEYFLPYTQDALLEIVTDKNIRKRLEKSKLQNRNLDAFVEKYNLQDHPNIRIMNDIPFSSDSPNWINDVNDISDLSLWDFLADAISVAKVEENRHENTSYLNTLATLTLNSRIDFHYTKLALSFLIYIDDDGTPLDNFHPLFNNGPNYNFEETTSILNNFCRAVFEYIILDDDYIIHEIESYQEREFYEYPHLKKRITQICDIIIESYNHLDKTLYKNQIIKLVDVALKEFHPAYAERTKTITVLHTLQSGQTVHTKSAQVLEKWRCIDDSYYENTKATLIKDVFSTKIDYFTAKVETIGTISPADASTFNKMRSFFAPNGGTTSFGKHHYYEANGCFSLLVTSNNKRYFAFSSAKELFDKGKMENLVKIVMKNIFHETNVNNVYAHTYSYNWCYLCDTLDARRYTEILTHGSEDPTKYIKSHETYDVDVSSNQFSTHDEISNTYGCCERKIFAYAGYSSDMEIYSRWAPCWRCRPAILDTTSCDVYAFADLDDYKKNKKVDMSLKKYTVIPSYSVKP